MKHFTIEVLERKAIFAYLSGKRASIRAICESRQLAVQVRSEAMHDYRTVSGAALV